MQNRVKTIISEGNTKRSPHVMAPVVVTVRDGQEEELTHIREDEHLRIQEAIRQGNLRLRELEQDQERLRKKIIWMDVEIKGWKMRSCKHVSSINQG